MKKLVITLAAVAAITASCHRMEAQTNTESTTAEVSAAMQAKIQPQTYGAYLAPELIEGIATPSNLNNHKWVLLYANEGDQFDYEAINGLSTIAITIPDSLATAFLADWSMSLEEGYPIEEEYGIRVDASNPDNIVFSIYKEQ